jgi:hypothetical protein
MRETAPTASRTPRARVLSPALEETTVSKQSIPASVVPFRYVVTFPGSSPLEFDTDRAEVGIWVAERAGLSTPEARRAYARDLIVTAERQGFTEGSTRYGDVFILEAFQHPILQGEADDLALYLASLAPTEGFAEAAPVAPERDAYADLADAPAVGALVTFRHRGQSVHGVVYAAGYVAADGRVCVGITGVDSPIRAQRLAVRVSDVFSI